jgi:hypothetical protein
MELFLQVMALHHLRRKLIVKTCPSHMPIVLETPTMDSRKKTNKGNQSLTVHLLPELGCLLAPLGHLSL